MRATAKPPLDSPHPGHLTFLYTNNDDGWVTAQIAEYPEAISQGPSKQEAMVNVLEAFHELTHEPTFAERLAFMAQGRVVEPVEGFVEYVRDILLRRLSVERRRDRILWVKRSAFERWLRSHDARLLRNGAKHDIWVSVSGQRSSVPRHREIKDATAKKICEQLLIPPPG